MAKILRDLSSLPTLFPVANQNWKRLYSDYQIHNQNKIGQKSSNKFRIRTFPISELTLLFIIEVSYSLCL